jgi:hypothetical protein
MVRLGFHSGHSDSCSNHVGPFVHREDDCNWDDVIPTGEQISLILIGWAVIPS